jgi:hypothetical protein
MPAFPRQIVKPCRFVRTRELSQMALLLPDRTQLLLNQNSQMQIKTVADARSQPSCYALTDTVIPEQRSTSCD